MVCGESLVHKKPIIHFKLIHYRNIQGGREIREVKSLIRLYLVTVRRCQRQCLGHEQGRGNREMEVLSAQPDNGTEVLV